MPCSVAVTSRSRGGTHSKKCVHGHLLGRRSSGGSGSRPTCTSTPTATTQLTNGVPLPDSIRDYLTCDSQVQPVWERDHTPIGAGRTQRTVPDRTRRIIEHRDQGCRVPGCGRRHVEIHHIVHWSAGGPTETWNLLSLCSRHHRLHHRGILGIAGNADEVDGVVFTDRHGRVLDDHPKPTPPTGSSTGRVGTPPGNDSAEMDRLGPSQRPQTTPPTRHRVESPLSRSCPRATTSRRPGLVRPEQPLMCLRRDRRAHPQNTQPSPRRAWRPQEALPRHDGRVTVRSGRPSNP